MTDDGPMRFGLPHPAMPWYAGVPLPTDGDTREWIERNRAASLAAGIALADAIEQRAAERDWDATGSPCEETP